MSPGDIILINFPFTVPSLSKVRPAVVIAVTDDRFQDLIICAISSVLPSFPTKHEILVLKSDQGFSETGLRVSSVVKIDRIATLRHADVITAIGHCPPNLWKTITDAFRNLVR